jgi:hypothetical protein
MGPSSIDNIIRSIAPQAEAPKYIRAYRGVKFPVMPASPPFYSMPAERVAALRNDPDASAVSRELMAMASPGEWRRAREFLEQNDLTLGEFVGAGQERLAFEVGTPGKPADAIFKIGGPKDNYDLPEVLGVASYPLRASEGALNFGVQPRAIGVYADGRLPYEYWQDRAWDVHRSLVSRGFTWIDPHEGNIGLMPDRTWAVIDGPVGTRWDATPYTPTTAAEAIRLLRFPPQQP